MKTLLLLVLCSLVVQAQDLKVSKPAIKQSGVKVKSSGVPTYEFKPGTPIPKLKIGTEREVNFQEIKLKEIPPAPQTFQGVKKNLEIPLIKPTQNYKWEPVVAAKNVFSAAQVSKVPEVKVLQVVAEPIFKESNPVLKDIRTFSSNEFKMIEALIFLQIHKNFEMSFAIFSELFKDKELEDEARFFYAESARNLKLPKEFRNSLLNVAKNTKNQDLKKSASAELAQHISVLEYLDIKDIEPLVLQYEVDVTSNDAYNYFRAKYYLENGNLGQVEDALSLINEKSSYFADSLLISALFNYRQGQVDKAEKQLEQILKVIAKDSPARSVAGITLARIYFQKNKFKEAFQAYLEVDKSHPFWMQAMVEQAWTQILSKDFEGAAGNMFPLHTDFFKNAFNAESYVVRTVAYLNLCQFGDASSVLQNLGRKYAPLYGRMEAYLKLKKEPQEFFETVRAWLQNPEQKEVDGIPRSVIVEWAKHPTYISLQKSINSYEDEANAFNQITLNLIQREKDLLQLTNETNKKISEVRTQILNPKNNKEVLKAEELKLVTQLSALKYESGQTNRARNQVKVVRDSALVRLDQEKKIVRKIASETLQKRFVKLTNDLKNLLEQNEVLQYEIYAGAGEHIRFQTASGEVNKEQRDQLKVEKTKAMKWSFKGEIWEDEIGHFRSSLKSACPPDESAQQ
ncbi:MAG: tetratricopeptide repeat protein [Bdellovibrionales bacterium]